MVPILFSFKNKLKGFLRRTKKQAQHRTRKPTIIIPGVEVDFNDKYARIPVIVDKK